MQPSWNQYSPSRETLKGMLTLHFHPDKFTPEFHAYARECWSDPERRSYYMRKYETNWPAWRDPFYAETLNLLKLTRGKRCQPPNGEPPCPETWNQTDHHLRYRHWGAEVAYLEDLRNVCLVHHEVFSNAQEHYVALDFLLRQNLSLELHNKLAAERDQLALKYGIGGFEDLPYTLQKRIKEWRFSPTYYVCDEPF